VLAQRCASHPKWGHPVTEVSDDRSSKTATAARIYDYQLGGTHNFEADRAAAEAITKLFPGARASSRANRAFLGRAVRYAASQGIRQFLDIGSGIPTESNVHEIAQSIVPEAHVVYVDIDPVAVSESLDLLEGSQTATSVWGDMREPHQILQNPQVRALIDFDQPVALVMSAVMHFMPDEIAYDIVDNLVAALAPGSMLILSQAALEAIMADVGAEALESGEDVYRRQTASTFHARTRAQTERFFSGRELVEPGLVYVPSWRPDPAYPSECDDNPAASAVLGAVAKIS
jgi:S-adenosyl methyltransferase